MKARSNTAAPLVLSLLLLGGCATTPPEEDPVQIKMNDLDRRLERLERVLSNQSLLELSQQIQSLQKDLRSMRGDLEKIQYASDNGKNQQRDLYGDLDRRLQTLEKGAASPVMMGTSDAGQGPLVPSGSDRANYQAAFELLRSGKHAQATDALQRFMTTFPNSPLAGNAQYWLGQSYYVTQNFPEALLAFRAVLEKYASSDKASDAGLKIGLIQSELKDWRAAREALNRVKADFPGTPAAQEAARKLEQMAAEGH